MSDYASLGLRPVVNADARLTRLGGSLMPNPVLPATLGEAVDEMEQDPIVRQALGDHVFERLVGAQRAEWGEFRRHVSQWERDRYREVY